MARVTRLQTLPADPSHQVDPTLLTYWSGRKLQFQRKARNGNMWAAYTKFRPIKVKTNRGFN